MKRKPRSIAVSGTRLPKKPTKKGQRFTKLEKCPTCYGNGYTRIGDCGRGCCGNMTDDECYSCKGSGVRKLRYKAVLAWELQTEKAGS